MRYRPDDLTGKLVREVRERYRLTRVQFSELAGLPGKSTSRLMNIERLDSWKPGDRETIAWTLNKLLQTPTTQTFEERIRELMHEIPEPIMWPADDCDDSNDSHSDDSGTPDTLTDDPIVIMSPVDDETPVIDVLPTPTESTLKLPMPAMSPDDDDALDELADAPDYVVSNSELQTWKRCRRKWWLSYYRRLALRTEDFVGVRAVGDRVHRALAAWYVPDGEPRVDPRDALERVIVEDWTRVTQLATERDVDEARLAELARDYATSTNLERAMLEGYVEWLAETGADADLRVVAAETEIRARVDVATDRSTYPVDVIGLLDVRARRVSDDARLFLDHKTVGDLKTPVVTLPQNEQMLHYHLLEWLTTPESEARCDGALYNMMRRVKRTAAAKPPFYERVEVRHNAHELEAYRRRLLAATRDVLTAVERLERGDEPVDVVYPTPKPDCRWDCDFFAVCNLFDDGSRAEDMLDVLYHEVDPRQHYNRDQARQS